MILRDFLSFSTNFAQEYLEEIKRNKSNFANLLAFLPNYLEKKFKYSTNNRSQISDFLRNFFTTLENFHGSSKEVSLFASFFMEDDISQKKLGFYLKARKTIVTYLYYGKTQSDDLDNIELTLNQWSTLTNRLFNEFSNFQEILKGVTDQIKSHNQKTPALQKKNTIIAINLLEIWLQFFEKFKNNCNMTPKKQSPSKKKSFCNNEINFSDSDNKTLIPNLIIHNEEKAFMTPPNSYYKEMIERGEEICKESLINRDENFLRSYVNKMEDDNNLIGKSMINIMDYEGEKIGEFLKQDCNKFKVFIYI